MSQRFGIAFPLQPEFIGIDRAGGIDREHECEVDSRRLRKRGTGGQGEE